MATKSTKPAAEQDDTVEPEQPEQDDTVEPEQPEQDDQVAPTVVETEGAPVETVADEYPGNDFERASIRKRVIRGDGSLVLTVVVPPREA